MPRETVRGSDYNFVPVAEGIDASRGAEVWKPELRLGQLEIGWSKSPTGCVDVATGDASMLYGPEGLLVQVSRAIDEGADIEVVIRDFFSGGSGFWVNLDREGCNQAVKRIRRARDDAFGRDE